MVFFIPIEWVEYNIHTHMLHSIIITFFFFPFLDLIRCGRIKHTFEYWNKTFFFIGSKRPPSENFLLLLLLSLFAPIDFRIYTFNLLFFELILAGCHGSIVGRSITEHCHQRTHGVWCHPWLNCVDVFCSMQSIFLFNCLLLYHRFQRDGIEIMSGMSSFIDR